MDWKHLLAYITGTVDQELLVRNEYLVTENRLILFGEASLRHALTQYVEHFHHERNHQGKGNVLLFPAASPDTVRQGPMQCRERLGGLLKYYAREAA
jgi:hypothetical protein